MHRDLKPGNVDCFINPDKPLEQRSAALVARKIAGAEHRPRLGHAGLIGLIVLHRQTEIHHDRLMPFVDHHAATPVGPIAIDVPDRF